MTNESTTCTGCGTRFKTVRGLISHTSRPFIDMHCKNGRTVPEKPQDDKGSGADQHHGGNMTDIAKAIELVLYVSANGGWNWVKVTFSGPEADAIAAQYISTHLHLVHDEARFWEQDLDTFPLASAAMSPTCEHGMSLQLCMGPMHFPSAEQEREWEIF